MAFTPLVSALIESLRCLPGVGPKSAQRMAFYLLQRDRAGGERLAKVLAQAMKEVGHCERCRILSEKPLCDFCQNAKRQQSVLLVVETPADVLAIESAQSYHGLYFVLMGHLSPIEGLGPQSIGLDLLHNRLASGEIQELILATNPTVEGEATAFYIADMAKKCPHPVKVTRIAHGVPLGGELEYLDGGTLAKALACRNEFA
jgi:recombination protein RecR